MLSEPVYEPNRPNQHVERRSDKARLLNEGEMGPCVSDHAEVSEGEGHAFNKDKQPDAGLNDGSHERVQLNDQTMGVQDRGHDEVQCSNRKQEQEGLGWEKSVEAMSLRHIRASGQASGQIRGWFLSSG